MSTPTANDPPTLSVMIAGAQKSGTSSLNTYLGTHPATRVTREPAHGESPELVYFLRPDRFGGKIPWSYLYGEDLRGTLVGKSAGLMYDDEAIARLRAHFPDVDVAVILRDPVRRAFSAYQHNRRRGLEPATTFEEAIQDGPTRFPEGDERRFRCAYIEWSCYADYLPHLYATFGREKVHVLLFEQFVQDPRGCVTALVESVGLDPDEFPDEVGHVNVSGRARSQALARALRTGRPATRLARRVLPLGFRHYVHGRLVELNTATDSRVGEQLDPRTARRLRERFAESDARLGAMLGRDLGQFWGGD
jgi:hypothetical protein